MKKHGVALADNAFIFGVGRLFARVRAEESLSNVNVLALAGLADALVMHDEILIDSIGWEFLTKNLPERWISDLYSCAQIQPLELPKIEDVVDSVLNSDNAKLLCQALNWLDNSGGSDELANLRQSYLSYTGHELGAWRTEQRIIDQLSEGIGEDGWLRSGEFNLRTLEHVSTLQCMVRAIQYCEFSANSGYTYYSHEFRGRVINAVSSIGTNTAYKEFWDYLISKMQDEIVLKNSEKWIWKSEKFQNSTDYWEKFNAPIFLGMALNDCTHVNELLSRILDLRAKADPLRKIFSQFTSAVQEQDHIASKKLLIELNAISDSLAKLEKNRLISRFSISFGLPLGISIGYQPTENKNLKTLTIARDLYENYQLPYTFYDDINRLLGSLYCSYPLKYPNTIPPRPMSRENTRD